MADSSSPTGWPRRYGRYLVFEEFARGGMASVHLGRLVADRGFSRLVAVKMLSADRAASSFYTRALEDEARIASRVRHPNVVQPLDVVAERGDVLYVMEYVHGVSLSHLLDEARTKRGEPLPRDVTAAVMLDVLSALHAAHEAKDETGRPLGVVHRDVSPQNVLVGLDGLARLADFGVAKAMRREERTATGAVKGKLAYMSPEQQRGLPVTRQADVYAAGVVLAASLTGASPAPIEEALTAEWLRAMIERIDDRALADIVTTATKPQARDRYGTAAEMSAALSSACARATAEAVGACVQDLAGDVLEQRGELARRVESADANADADASASADADANANANMLAAPAPAPAPAPALARSFFTPGFLLLFAASLTVGAFLVHTAMTRAPDPAIAAAATPPPIASASAPAFASASASALASASADPPPLPPGLAVSAGAATTRWRPPSIRPRPPAEAPAPPTPPTTRAADCDPPFRIDAQGRKHYKPECAP